ncbi:MAG: tetratricopeptide repeat protein [Bacteroidetes bacterium]|nr:tetratricopeptide repeat protein [Bacteroidota bacterium]
MKTRLATLLVILITAVPSLSYSQVAGGTVAEQQDYTFALGLYRDGQYQLAFDQFKKFLENYPGSRRADEITFLSGECLLQEKMYDSALSDYQKVMEKYPGSSYFTRSELRSGEIYLQINQLSKSEKLLKSVLANSDDNDVKGEAAYKLGELFVSSEDYNNAIKYFDLCYQGYRESGYADYAMYGSAWCYGKLGNFNESKKGFEALIVSYPDTKLSADATEKMGECDFFLGNDSLSVAELKRAMGLSSDAQVMEPALYFEGKAYSVLGMADSATAAYSEYIDRFPAGDHSSEVRVLLSKLLLASKEGAGRALELLNQVSPDSPVYFDSRIETGRAYEAAGFPDSAEAALTELVKSSQNPEKIARVYFELGKVYFQNKSYTESEQAFLAASKLPAQYPEAMKNAALSAAAEGDYNHAKLYFLDAISRLTGKELVDAHFDYAAALYAAGDYLGAANVYTATLGIALTDDQRAEALFMSAESFYRGGDYRSSLADYQKYLHSFANGAHASAALLGVGYSYYFSNEFIKAAQAFQNFIDTYPNSPLLTDAYFRLGDCFYYYQDYQKALGVYANAAVRFQSDTSSAYAWYQLGQTHFKLGQNDSALTSFNYVLSRYPNTSVAPEAQYAIGWVRFSEKEYTESISDFNKVVADFPASPIAARALYSKGDAYYNLGQYQQALASYRELLEKHPTSNYVDNALVGMQYCLTLLGRSTEAEQVIDSFVRSHPNLPHVDRIYYKKIEYALNQKRYSDAERYLKEFIVKFPNSSMSGKAYYNLALVEITLRKERSAIGVLSDLINKKPGNEYTTAGMVKLAEIYQSRREYGEAEKLFTEAASAGDDYTTAAQVGLGRLYLQEGDTLRAESNLSKAALSQTDSLNDGQKAEAKVLLSEIYFDRGRTQDAISLANSVAKTRDDLIGAQAQLHVAEYYCASGDSSNAVLAFLKVKYVFAGFSDIVAESQLKLANCLMKFGNRTDAKSLLEEFIKGRADDSYARQARKQLEKLESH